MEKHAWTCPFCNHHSTVGDDDIDFIKGTNFTESVDGKKFLQAKFVVCPNGNCKKLTLNLVLLTTVVRGGHIVPTSHVTHFWHLIPESTAKVFSTEIVPKAIVADYEEACKIKALSPKSSATLARRALQGMIRNFWQVSRPPEHKGPWRLVEEIKAIENKVDPNVWAAIDAVRKVGNIGAHMEQDVNVVIDIEPEEAEKLIWLVELLIEQWYIRKHETELKLAEIKGIGDSKVDTKKILEEPK